MQSADQDRILSLQVADSVTINLHMVNSKCFPPTMESRRRAQPWGGVTFTLPSKPQWSPSRTVQGISKADAHRMCRSREGNCGFED